jgi:predicted dehydrogenase
MARNQSKPIRYAVVGAGHVAQTAVLPAFEHARENSELVAIISSNDDKRAELARAYGISHTGSYDDFENVLREAAADATYIAVPNTLHREFTERSAAARVHVLCEKPMATTAEDCQAMIAATDQAGVKLMIAYRLHFEQANLTAVELVRSGRIGEPRIFDATLTQEVRSGDIRTRSETGGGALFDLGPYCVNAARYLFREEPTEVVALAVLGTDDDSSEVDETSGALLRFSEGRIAHFSVSQGATEVSCFRLIGTQGDLRLDPATSYEKELVHYLTIGGKTECRRFAKRDQFAAEIVYFSRCVQTNCDPEPSGWEGLADVRVLSAAARSAETGRSVTLPPFDRRVRPDMTQNIEKPPVREPKPPPARPPTIH